MRASAGFYFYPSAGDLNISKYEYTRFPSGTCLGEWRKNELKNIRHVMLYHTHMISFYDVMKYLCCSTCGSMHVSHSSRDPRRPTDRRVR